MGKVNFGHVKGADGQGVPAGGGTGSFLRKLSAADWDTEWKDVLPVDSGGTGATSAADARAALGAQAALGADNLLPVDSGGTGATSAAAARAALGAQAALGADNLLPVASGGTGAGNAADARAALGAWEPPTLLWTNASPSSTFAQQTIGGAWSAYTAFLVEYFVHVAQVGHRCIALIPKSVEMSPFHYLGAFGANYWRYVVINDSGVLFYGGYYRADGGSSVADNMMMIPYKIFGLKGVSL